MAEPRAVLLILWDSKSTVIVNESTALSEGNLDMTTTGNPTHSDTAPTMADGDHSESPHYDAPDWFTSHVFNPIVARCTRWGISVMGSRVLSVQGRVTGTVHSTPVNVLVVDGRRYLVAARGATQWVRNVRAAGGCSLRLGRRVEDVRLRELDDRDKPEVLRAYLRRWSWEVGRFFDGVGADSTDAELLAVARRHPVFEIAST